jgi:small-conductance mechanosensitive channel
MHERRVLFSIGLVYNTSAEKLLKATEIIKSIIEEKENVRFDRSNFSAFGNFSLNIETVYYLKSSDYNTYTDIQQDVLLEIKRQFTKEKLDFAFPTQTVYLEK